MTRSILCGLLALLSVAALGIVPAACQSGGVGDPCTPEDEYSSQFPGFKVEQENIESRSFQCATRICLVNHFQGRVSCPLGQDSANVKQCSGPNDSASCGGAKKCTAAQVFSPQCTVCSAADKMAGCQDVACPAGLTCENQVCTCKQAAMIGGIQYACELADPHCSTPGGCAQVLRSYLCHEPSTPTKSTCQSASGTVAQNTGADGKPLDCCLPGTDIPVGVSVCGQCNATSKRDAPDSVYCSCRCCAKCCDDPSLTPADVMAGNCEMDKTLCGSACDPNFNYCKCPTGFTCSEIRKKVGLGDAQLTGAYCIKQGSAWSASASTCGAQGFTADMSCKQ